MLRLLLGKPLMFVELKKKLKLFKSVRFISSIEVSLTFSNLRCFIDFHICLLKSIKEAKFDFWFHLVKSID